MQTNFVGISENSLEFVRNLENLHALITTSTAVLIYRISTEIFILNINIFEYCKSPVVINPSQLVVFALIKNKRTEIN